MLFHTSPHLISKVNSIVSDLQMRKLRSESLSGGTGDWTAFDFKQSSFNCLSLDSPLKWWRSEVKPHQSAIIIKRSLWELESMKEEEFNQLQQHIISWTRVIQVVLSNVPIVPIDMFLCYLYINFIYKTIWTHYSPKFFKQFI